MDHGHYQRCCTDDEILIKAGSWMNVCCPKGTTSAEYDWSADSGYRCYDADGEEL